jgi:hypothetical protein
VTTGFDPTEVEAYSAEEGGGSLPEPSPEEADVDLAQLDAIEEELDQVEHALAKFDDDGR